MHVLLLFWWHPTPRWPQVSQVSQVWPFGRLRRRGTTTGTQGRENIIKRLSLLSVSGER